MASRCRKSKALLELVDPDGIQTSRLGNMDVAGAPVTTSGAGENSSMATGAVADSSKPTTTATCELTTDVVAQVASPDTQIRRAAQTQCEAHHAHISSPSEIPAAVEASAVPVRGNPAAEPAVSGVQPQAVASTSRDLSIPQNVKRATIHVAQEDLPWLRADTPIWSRVVRKFKDENRKLFEAIRSTGDGNESHEGTVNDLTRSTSADVKSQLRRWLPILDALRSIALTAAAGDPHKIAPIVVASVFFSINVSSPRVTKCCQLN
jgi:hypothetical protein